MPQPPKLPAISLQHAVTGVYVSAHVNGGADLHVHVHVNDDVHDHDDDDDHDHDHLLLESRGLLLGTAPTSLDFGSSKGPSGIADGVE